jgi:hypothetical protein
VALADARYTMRWLLILCDVFVCFYVYSFLLSAALVSQRKSFRHHYILCTSQPAVQCPARIVESSWKSPTPGPSTALMLAMEVALIDVLVWGFLEYKGHFLVNGAQNSDHDVRHNGLLNSVSGTSPRAAPAGHTCCSGWSQIWLGCNVGCMLRSLLLV